jgi:hypothetical protein
MNIIANQNEAQTQMVDATTSAPDTNNDTHESTNTTLRDPLPPSPEDSPHVRTDLELMLRGLLSAQNIDNGNMHAQTCKADPPCNSMCHMLRIVHQHNAEQHEDPTCNMCIIATHRVTVTNQLVLAEVLHAKTNRAKHVRHCRQSDQCPMPFCLFSKSLLQHFQSKHDISQCLICPDAITFLNAMKLKAATRLNGKHTLRSSVPHTAALNAPRASLDVRMHNMQNGVNMVRSAAVDVAAAGTPRCDHLGEHNGEVSLLASLIGGGGDGTDEGVGTVGRSNSAMVKHTAVNAVTGAFNTAVNAVTGAFNTTTSTNKNNKNKNKKQNNNNNNNNESNRTKSKAEVSRAAPKRWTPSDDEALLKAKSENPTLKWKDIAAFVPNRSEDQCYQHWTRTLNPDLTKKRQLSEVQETELENLYRKHGNDFAKIAIESNRSYETVHYFFNQTRRGKGFRKPLDDSGLPRKRKAISSRSSSRSSHAKQNSANNNKKNKTSELELANMLIQFSSSYVLLASATTSSHSSNSAPST